MLRGQYPLLIALVFGVMAGAIAYSAIKKMGKDAREGWNPQHILCARQDMEEGTELNAELVDVCEIPEEFVTKSFIVVPEDNDRDVIPYGQRIVVPLNAHDPILYSHFQAQTEFAASSAVPKHARAVSIDVSERSSVDQLIRPNDHIDVVGTFRDNEGGKGALKTATILQDVIVMATGHHMELDARMDPEDKHYTHIAVLVTPDEVELLALAQESGTLTMSLRNPDDLDMPSPVQIDEKKLFTSEKITPPHRVWQPELIKGPIIDHGLNEENGEPVDHRKIQ